MIHLAEKLCGVYVGLIVATKLKMSCSTPSHALNDNYVSAVFLVCGLYLRIRDGNRSGRPAPVGLLVDRPVGSRFFDRPVKPVEKPVEFSFLATKRNLSTNRNVLIYFIINKTFYKKSVLTNHTFRKHLLNGFKL